MKRFLIALALILSLSLVFVGCDSEDTTDTTKASQDSTETTDSSGTTDSGDTTGSGDTTDSSDTTGSGDTTDSSDTTGSGDTTDSSDTTGSGDTTDSSDTTGSGDTTDSSDTTGSGDTTDSSDTTDKETPDINRDPDPNDKTDPENNIPDTAIEIATNGVSPYVIVYDGRDDSVRRFTERLVKYLSDTHGITLPTVEATVGTSSEYCIYIGNVKAAQRTKEKLNETGDFGACVSGNDYVMYATNSRLYDYMYDVLTSDVLVTIRGGTWSTRPAKNFIYHNSKYAETPYLEYVLAQNNGALTQDVLYKLFEPRTFVASDGTTLVYRIYVPYDYDSGKSYPVLTFMHGAGERGNNNTGNMKHMLLNMFKHENTPLWESIIICPQCPDGQQWVDTPWKEGGYRVDEVPESNEIKAALEILDKVEADYPTDLDRYYVMGLSMGGFAAWDMIMRHTERFAAAVPLCGGGDYKQAHKLINKPIYTIHDKRDFDVPFSGTKEMVVALEILGSTVIRYEELSGNGHNIWDYASQKAEIWTWLYEQSLENQ